MRNSRKLGGETLAGKTSHSHSVRGAGESMMRVSLVALLAFASLNVVSWVRAQEGEVAPKLDIEARTHFETGSALFESGEYERALSEFEEAYRLSGRSRLLFNMALAHERLGQLDRAIPMLRAYVDSEPDLPNRGRLELRIQRMQARVAEEREQAQRASEEGKKLQRQETAAPDAKEPAWFQWRSPAVITALSVIGVGAIAAGVFGALTLREKSRLEGACAPDCKDSELGTLHTYSMVTDAGLGLAALGVVGGAVWVALDARKSSSRVDSPRVSLWIDPRSTGARLQGRF